MVDIPSVGDLLSIQIFQHDRSLAQGFANPIWASQLGANLSSV